jgi:hypothetical protein
MPSPGTSSVPLLGVAAPVDQTAQGSTACTRELILMLALLSWRTAYRPFALHVHRLKPDLYMAFEMAKLPLESFLSGLESQAVNSLVPLKFGLDSAHEWF